MQSMGIKIYFPFIDPSGEPCISLTNERFQNSSLIVSHSLQKQPNRCVRLAFQLTSQQYCSLILNQHQPPATSRLAVLFFHNKSTPATSHSQANTTNIKSNERWAKFVNKAHTKVYLALY